jgi:hypothetical protein
MHLEAQAITDTTDLAIEQGFNGQDNVIWQGKCSRLPDATQETQSDDEHSHHIKLQASECALNNRYCPTAPPASHKELEESSSSRSLKYIETRRPGNLLEIPHQDKVFLAENPECLAVKQGKRGRDDGYNKIVLQLPRNDNSSTIINSHLKSSESIQPSVTQAGARTYAPCSTSMSKSANLRIEDGDYRSISV